MSLCNTCGSGLCGGCGQCGQCQPKCGCENKCQKPCGCPESILSIEADTTDPTKLRFNLGGRSVWYDFTSVVKAAETCTKLKPDAVRREVAYDAECGRQTISAQQLGSIFHLSDIGDVDTAKIGDNAVLVYRKFANCGENCEGATGWIGVNPTEEAGSQLEYVIGSDANGAMKSLMPPASSTNQFYYLSWAGREKATWKQPTIATAAPLDDDGKAWRVYMDPKTHELVVVKEDR